MFKSYYMLLSKKIYWGNVKLFCKFEIQKSKVKTTTWPNMDKTQFWSHISIQMRLKRTFVNRKDLLGQFKHFWKFEVLRLKVKVTNWPNMGKIQRSKVMVTTWPNMVQITVLRVMTKSDAHYKGGFWRPVCNLGLWSQPEAGGIPSMFQHWILSSCS